VTTRTVKTQAELNAALADSAVTYINIVSERGVWLRLLSSGSATVEASGSATVEASGSATVEASGSATVRAYGSATVRASGSATVEASGSATVEASGSATVRASGSATVEASGSATVRASGSATVRASGSATVEAYDSATVRASGSATVHGRNTARITATSHVAVHLHQATVTVSGGVLINHAALNLEDPQAWCAYHGVTVTDGVATVYKAVDDEWTTCHGSDYSPGATPSAPDWSANNHCGGGLHFGPTPMHARYYHEDATRYLACPVAVADLRPILGGTAKCKAPRVLAPGCVEVDLDGRIVERQPAAATG
jgi:hypothetical protein